MTTDFNKPVVGDAYTAVLPSVVTALQDLARGLDPVLTGTHTNIPTGAKRFNESGNTWERFNGTSWVALSVSYAINISGTAATASALVNTNDYTIKERLSFHNGGTGGGYLRSNDPVNGFVYRPSINGSSNLHTWTDSSGSGLLFLNTSGTLIAAGFSGSGAGLTGTASSLSIGGTAATASALVNTNNYTIKETLNFYNGGTGSGYIQSNDATWGLIYKPSVNGSSASHLWVNNAGSFLASLNASGVFAAAGFSGDHTGTINSATTATTQTSTDNSTKVATTAFVQANKPIKAWVNFNGAAATINASAGVSSITRTSGGEYRVNLSTTQPDTNYAVVSSTSTFKWVATHHNGRTTSYYTITTFDSTNGSAGDATQIYSILVGN